MGLFYVARHLPRGATVVEIGSWKGKSTVCIARGLRQGTIHAIDPFDASGEQESAAVYSQSRGVRPLIEQFQENLHNVGLAAKVEVCPGLSRDHVGKFPRIDFLFIDGDHSREGCLFDYEHFASAVAPGGYLAFHDYDPARQELGPTWVVHQHVAKDARFRFHARFDSLWVARRKSH